MDMEKTPESQTPQMRRGVIILTVVWFVAAAVLFFIPRCYGYSRICEHPGRPYSLYVVLIGLIATGLLYRSESIKTWIENRKATATASRVVPSETTSRLSQTTPSPQRPRGLDVRFNRFVTPVIVQILYVILLVLMTVGVAAYWLMSISDWSEDFNPIVFALLTFPLALIGWIFLWLIIRLVCESAIALFRIAEDLRSIRNRQSQ